LSTSPDFRLPALCFPDTFSGNGTLALFLDAGGVPGRLETADAVDILDLPLFFPGVPNPSSLRSASDVSGSTSFQPCLPVLSRPLSERCSVPLFVPTEEAVTKFAAVDPGGVPTEAKLLTDPEPRRNWLMDALEGLGGRWEKSLGAKCLMKSWVDAEGD
jgi:hypothetical protein